MALDQTEQAEIQDAANRAAAQAVAYAIGNFGQCLLKSAMETLPLFLKSFIACLTGAGSDNCKP